MLDATYVGAGMPCGQCGNPLTPGQPHKCGRVGNPYESERLRAERDAALAAGQKLADLVTLLGGALAVFDTLTEEKTDE